MDLEKKAQQFEADLKKLQDFAEDNKEVKTLVDNLQKKFDNIKEFDPKESEEFKALDKDLNELKKQVKNMEKEEAEEVKTFEEEIKRILGDPQFEKDFKEGKMKGRVGKSYELKVDTTAFTGDRTISQLKPGANYPREEMLTVAPLFNIIPMQQDKSKALWIEGAYTSNVAYVGEGVANPTADTGVEVEKTREIAKVGAKLPLTAEMFEDLSAFAARLQNKLRFNVEKFVNNELISGDGNDATQKKHIYGLITQGSTPFAAGALANQFKAANIDDLAAAVKVQAGAYMPNVVVMNRLTITEYSRIKATDGQYVIREVNGQMMYAGMQVVASEAMANNAALFLDTATLFLWVKRNLEFKIGQEGTDLSDDKFTAVVFWRGQSVVEGPDKAANIYVADIDAALVALDPDRT